MRRDVFVPCTVWLQPVPLRIHQTAGSSLCLPLHSQCLSPCLLHKGKRINRGDNNKTIKPSVEDHKTECLDN